MSQGARTLPWSQEAEMSVVGGILLHPKALAEVAALLPSGEEFYHPAHGAIYQAMLDVDRSGHPVDAITVAEHMRAADTFHKLRAMNGESYFADLTSAVVTVENIGHHAKIVKGKAVVRRIIETTQEIAALGYGDYGSVDDYAAMAERKLREASDGAVDGGYRTMHAVMGETFRGVEERYKNRGDITGVPCGLEQLDGLTGGDQAGHLIVIGGRPGTGKTAKAMSGVSCAALAEHADGTPSGRAQIPHLIFSLEMVAAELGERAVASDGRIDSVRLKNATMNQNEWIQFTKSAGRLASAPIWVDDRPRTFQQIRAIARRWRQRETDPRKLARIVVDYLQLIVPEKQKGRREDNREREVAEWSRGLKELAKELACPVVALAQINRESEKRGNKRPRSSDLRESGAVEADADRIELLYRDELINPESKDKGIAEIIVDKNRHGPTGVCRARYLAAYTRFVDAPSLVP